MPILVDRSSRVICFGMPTEEGEVVTHQLLSYGTLLLAGVDAGKRGREVQGLPLFSSVRQAKKQTDANVCLILSPPQLAPDAIVEAEEAGIPLIICVSDNVPVHDLVDVMHVLRRRGKSRLIGPGSAGVITPEQTKVGIMPGFICSPGKVGVVSCSTTLAYDIIWQMTKRGIGQSTCVWLGEREWVGSSVLDIIQLFEKDIETSSIVMIGEIGKMMEEEVAEWLQNRKHKPVTAYLAGRALPEKDVGRTTAERKVALLQEAGVRVVNQVTDDFFTKKSRDDA
jgi:succinyl-CoA synthetase alpha subunit